MESSSAEKIARTLLYEGYLLYPYRASALKNQRRWTFGGLVPRSYAEASAGTERWFLRAECLVRGTDATQVSVHARFLHSILKPARGSLTQEAIEREVSVTDFRLRKLASRNCSKSIAFPQCRTVDALQYELACEVFISATPVATDVFRLLVRVSNLTPFEVGEGTTRAEAVLRSLASAHVALSAADGEFVSLTDPPEEVRTHAGACRNEGVWAVLIGAPGRRDAMLAAPIILEDYPRIAPQSPGDFFDAAEIDEMLALRVLTLTEGEKKELRAADPRARAILERVESMPPSRFANLHGFSHRSLNPQPGDRIRLRPRGSADAFDILLEGKTATILSVEEDYEGTVYYAVTIDDDPGRDLGAAGQIGHRFFYRLDEIEPLSDGDAP